MASKGLAKSICGSIAVATCLLAITAGSALGDTTHKYLHSFNTPAGSQPMPSAVDAQGSIYVYNSGYVNGTVTRYDREGNQVPFSALGSSTIDGKGGEDCPATPADCDRVPSNGFGPNSLPFGAREGSVAVDNSGGPTDGYIYVDNGRGGPMTVEGVPYGAVEVFDSTGRYRGELDKSGDGPRRSGPGGGIVNVSTNGHIFLASPGLPSVIDEFVPVDGNPAHNVFRGQIFMVADGCGFYGAREGVGDTLYSYANPCGDPPWHKFEYGEYTLSGKRFLNIPQPVFDVPDGIFGGGAGDFDHVMLDPTTHDVYLTAFGLEGNSRIEQWTPDNRQVGPSFGPPYVGDAWRIAIDSSHAANRGSVYTQGAGNNGDQISVFSPPVPIPDVIYGTPTIGHTTLRLTATLKLAGGPDITACELQWGTTGGLERKPLPCNEPAPYASDTVVTADLSNLLPGQQFFYRFKATTVNGPAVGRIQTIRPEAVLDVRTDEATDVTRTTATVHGTLNPDSIATTYRFEYGPTLAYGLETPVRNAAPGSVPGSVPGEPLDALQPGRTYNYRIAASNNLGTTYGQNQTVTMPDNPRVFAVRGTNVTASSADLVAKVTPLGSETTYYFEYGISRLYGNRSQETALPMADGTQEVTVHIDALQPESTYHFRVIATNKWGTTTSNDASFSFAPPNCPNAHVRQQTNGHYLPDCRAYELVSPENAGGTIILPSYDMIYWLNGTGTSDKSTSGWDFEKKQYPQNTGLATTPSKFGFYAFGSGLEGANVPNTLGDMYVATRTSQGWVTKYPGVPGDEYFAGANGECSADLKLCLQHPTLGGFTGSEDSRIDNSPLVYDTTTGEGFGRLPSNYKTLPDQGEFVGTDRVSDDFTNYAFVSLGRLFAPGGQSQEPGSVYDNDLTDDTVKVASLLPDGSHIPSEPGASKGPPGAPGPPYVSVDYLEVPGLSTDGSHILMGARTGARCSVAGRDLCPAEKRELNLYMRVNGALTYEVSKGHPVLLVDMTEDGSQVFFTTDEPLGGADTDTSVDLYRWNEASDSLTLLSQGNGQGDSDGCSADWTDQCDVQPVTTCTTVWTFQCDYDHQLEVYPEGHPFTSDRPDTDTSIARETGDILFESPEQLDPDNPGVPHQRNLYLFRNGHPQYVTTFDPGSKMTRFQLSPDGVHLAFLTDSRLTGYDNTSGPNVKCGVIFNHLTATGAFNTPCRAMYHYNAVADELECASCSPTGAPPRGDVTASDGGPFMADDGRTFFNTPDALVPADTNGLLDVYEFVDNRPQLISSGAASEVLFGGAIYIAVNGYVFPRAQTGLEAVSADGVDVYFSTFDTLAPQDRNGSFVKMYVARTNGGFPFNAPPLPCPAADECHGATRNRPVAPQVGTGAGLGTSGAVAPVGQKRKAAKRRKAQKRAERRRHAKKRKQSQARRGGARQGRQGGENHG